MCLLTLTLPWSPGENREAAKNGIGLGKSVMFVGSENFRRRDVGREGAYARQGQRRVSHVTVSIGKWNLGGFTHLETSFGSQLKGESASFHPEYKELAVK